MKAFQVDMVYFAMRHLHQPFEQAKIMPAVETLKHVTHFYEERGLWGDMIGKIFSGKKGKDVKKMIDNMPDPSKNWRK